LAGLQKLAGLQSLNLSRTSITDAGLVNLRRLKPLLLLRLHGTAVTDAGVKALQACLPDLQIARLAHRSWPFPSSQRRRRHFSPRVENRHVRSIGLRVTVHRSSTR